MKRKTTSNGAENKSIFRRSKKWKTFRDSLKVGQRKDPVTGSPLTKMANCHHMDLNPKHYDDVSNPEHFIMLNGKTHDTVHFLYSNDYDKMMDKLERLKELLVKMWNINNNK